MNKKIIGIIMVLGIILGFTTIVNAAADDADEGGTHECLFDVWTIVTAPTCTETGTEKAMCSCGAEETRTVRALGHTGGSYGNIIDSSMHYKKCSRCGEKYDGAYHNNNTKITISGNNAQHATKCSVCGRSRANENHTPGGEYAAYNGTTATHYQDCTLCGKTKISSSVSHNRDRLLSKGEANSVGEVYDDNNHIRCCSICWNSLTIVENKLEELHRWNTSSDNDYAHTCVACGHQHTKFPHHYYNLSQGAELESINTYCLMTDGENCRHALVLEKEEALSGLPVDEYACSDAEVKMPEVPEFLPGDYEVKLTGGTVRGRDGELITDLAIKDSWVQITPWGQKTIATHAGASEEYRQSSFNSILKQLEDMSETSLPIDFRPAYTGFLTSELVYLYKQEVVTKSVNSISESQAQNWPEIFRGISTLLDTITDGKPYPPTQAYDSSSQTFTLTYNHPRGGWMFLNSQLMTRGSSGLYTELMRYGNIPSPDPEPWTANVYYCYRTTDGQLPKNGYNLMYDHSSAVVYDSGRKEATVIVEPDMNKIDLTGYRYVGHAVDVGEIGGVSVASSPTSTSASAEVKVGWEYTRSAAMVTFFLEPVKLQYGHKWRDMSSNKSPDQILDVPSLSCISSENPIALEFPDFYEEGLGKCVISVKSLNKFFWPGFMLKEAEVVNVHNQNDKIWTKEYDDDTTTIFSNDSSSNRLQIEEKVYSHYKYRNPEGTKKEDAENSGYATDKQFWFIYNTPQIEIMHMYHEDSGGGSVLDKEGNPIKGVEQILHQWAKIESLQTDNIGLPHTIVIGDSGSVFSYEVPTLDLVQLEVYEVSDKGVETYKGTLYNDQRYKPSSKGKKLSGYNGIFEDYYMDTYNNLKAQFNNNDLFNTNKNWKLVFKYASVERVYIRFYDLKGNIIFTKDANGKHISQITDLIDKVNGYTHTITDIGEFTPVGYTINKEAYNKNFSDATSITLRSGDYDPKEIIAPPKDGDRYIIIFYSTEDTLRVDYRDTDNNPIQVPPNYISTATLEIPDTGTFVEVPEVPGYRIKEYRINPAYDGTTNDIPGPGIEISSVPTEISVPNTGKDQFIIVYYEKVEAPTKLIVEYREGTVNGNPLREPVMIPLETDVETPVSVPTIDGYMPAYHVKNDDPTHNPPYDIVVVGNPETGDQKVIIVYVTGGTPPELEPEEPGVITPDDNKEFVELKANTTTANEYNVETSVPTSEDLYVSGDVYSYKFIENIEVVPDSETVQVKVVQEYYTNLDTGAKSSVSTGTFPVTLDYSYYQVNKAELYDLKSLELENGAIKYYKNYDPATGAYEYMEDKAVLDVTKELPKIEYSKQEQIVEIKEGSTYLGRLDKVGNTYVITLNDIAYVKPTDLDEKYNENNLSEVLGVFGELTNIHLHELKITLGTDEVEILTGNSYKLNQKTEALKEGVNYLPYTPGRAPLYSFLEDKGLYVKESAVNQTYQTKMTGVYKMIEAVLSGDETAYNATTTSGDIALFNPATKEHSRNPIAVNHLSIHTPIINKTDIIVSDEHKKTIQLKDQGIAGADTQILTLEEAFIIDIPNNGAHKSDAGYGTKDYNHNGLLANDTNKLIKDKSEGLNDILTQEMYTQENGPSGEELSIGPAFAEYKLIKFPYDVYLVSGDNGTAEGKNIAPRLGKPEEGRTLFKANEWYNLYEYFTPNVTKYTFVIPVWVKDAHKYEGKDAIHVLIVAENCDAATLNAAKANPLSVTATGASNTNRNDYILRWSKDTYVSGRVYDLQIRDTDDPGFMGKIKPALSGDTSSTTSLKEMPIAQKGQVKAYNLGMKLGYRFYFDLKTKGISNKTVNIHPKIYYVSPAGVPTENISLFYHSKGSLYNKLTDNDLNVKMTMAGTHGQVNNAGYTAETVAARQIVPSRVFTNVVTIGKIMGGLSLQRDTEKLPFDNILEAAKAYGFGTDKTKFVNSAKESISVSGENDIKNAAGHWYGEFYLPASTIVVNGAGTTREQAIKGKPLTTGYLVVVFDEITTVEDDPEADYLTYSAPAETQWQKEGIETIITLPNGEQATIIAGNGAAMAIYQVGLRANNDYETEGTH